MHSSHSAGIMSLRTLDGGIGAKGGRSMLIISQITGMETQKNEVYESWNKRARCINAELCMLTAYCIFTSVYEEYVVVRASI